jgi:ribosome-binding protein aMBF1 (putative translation factor)
MPSEEHVDETQQLKDFWEDQLKADRRSTPAPKPKGKKRKPKPTDWSKLNRELSKVLSHARKDRGWTQVELSRRSGVPVKTISRLENAHKAETYTRRPHAETIKKLADALNIRLTWIDPDPTFSSLRWRVHGNDNY